LTVYRLYVLSTLYPRLWAGASVDVPEVRNVDYGLFQRCERRWVSSPPAGRRRGISLWLILIDTSSDWLSEYKCTAFPARSTCDVNGQFFCIAWHTAGYASQFSLVFAAAGLVTVTLANITTKKRRRRAWRIVSRSLQWQLSWAYFLNFLNILRMGLLSVSEALWPPFATSDV
jgi:hypothetical protein